MKPEIKHPLFTPTDTTPHALHPTKIDGLFYISPKCFEDARGFFAETAQTGLISQEIGKEFVIKQCNLSSSNERVARGFHAEGWNKLVKVMSGTAYCVLADIRPDSPTFLEVEHFLLGNSSDVLQGSLFISSGIANSLCAIEGPVLYSYGVDLLYEQRDKAHDQAISLFDSTLDIQWPFSRQELIFSQRDARGIELHELHPTIIEKPKTT